MALIDVTVPDIGDFENVPVIELHVSPGDAVKPEDPLITLESDKASMEVPAPLAGRIAEVLVKVGDSVSTGMLIMKLEAEGAASEGNDAAAAAKSKPEDEKSKKAAPVKDGGGSMTAMSGPAGTDGSLSKGLPVPQMADFGGVHASPAVRRLARELDIDLAALKGSGDKGRVTKEDVKRALSGGGGGAGASGGAGIPEVPLLDFSKFGPIEEVALSRLKKLSGPHLHRAWLNVPHVTHTDEADITELESYRKTLDGKAKADGYRITMLSFLLKASVACLKEFPAFNASLNASKDGLILKKYYNIGVAVDTPDGLVVPAIKDVDRKGIVELSKELGEVSGRMRDGKIKPTDIAGGTFSISSLGGIGGTNFTPIVSAPEVAILGVVRAQMKPVWNGEEFKPRLMLPLCVSYDHRVIDGALAARFTRRLCEFLGDVRQLVL
ncbi:MAG TPA: dihydrolipoyllysine-residue acetyltransferase [Hyphomicrobiaceae bacterium]|nr:dihydrolipoyllysine-residue acetyltransferase [Hyphomicrobiaceae bacterium]